MALILKNIKRFLHSFSDAPKKPPYLSLRVHVTEKSQMLSDGKMISFELAGPRDVQQIVKIQEQSYKGKAPWNAYALLEDMNTNKNALYIMAKHENRSIGFIGSWFVGEEAHITNVAVLPYYQAKGIATTLIKEIKRLAIEEGCNIYTLEVRISNVHAQHVYEKLGFSKGKIKKKYYNPDREDALEMYLNLEEERTERDHSIPII